MLPKRFTSPRSRRAKVQSPVRTHNDFISLDQTVFETLHETAMRDALVLSYNQPLLEMQKAQGLIPRRAKTLEQIYKALLKNAFEAKRRELALPKTTSHEEIALAVCKNLS